MSQPTRVLLAWMCLGLSFPAYAWQGVYVPASGTQAPAPSSVHSAAHVFRGLPGVVSVEPVFSDSEARYLVVQGERAMAASLRVEVRDDVALEELSHAARGAGLVGTGRGTLKLNPRARAQDTREAQDTPSNNEQWGLRNTGAAQEVELTDIQSRYIPGVVGEDVGLFKGTSPGNGASPRGDAPAELAGPLGRRIRVAVLDTGVELAHPVLLGKLHRTESECTALAEFKACMGREPDKSVCHTRYDQLDTDGNGYAMDCSGWNVLADKTNAAGDPGDPREIKDQIGHGTHVSGIIAANGAGPVFIQGVAREVEILPVQVLGPGEVTSLRTESGESSNSKDGVVPDPKSPEVTQPSAFADQVARGMLYAIRSGAQIINMSLGYSIHDDSELMRRMTQLARARGILVVAAAGNQSSRMPVFPCRYEGVICVGSFSADGSISHFSDFGDAVDVAAPGHKILSSWPTNLYPSFFTERKGYDFKSGTSMAAPFVTGLLARLLNAGHSSQVAYARLLSGARPHLVPRSMTELEPKFTLSGNVDLAGAFQAAPRALILPTAKDPALVALERQASLGLEIRMAKFKLSLKNYWRESRAVDLTFELPAGVSDRVRVVPTQVRLQNWANLEDRVIELRLESSGALDSATLPGAWDLRVRAHAEGEAERSFVKRLELVVPVRPMAAGSSSGPTSPGNRGIRRVGVVLPEQLLQGAYSFKRLDCPTDSDSMLFVRQAPKSQLLQLLVAQAGTGDGNGKLELAPGAFPVDLAKQRLLSVSCQGHAAERFYAVLTLLNGATAKDSPTLQLWMLGPDFRPLSGQMPPKPREFSAATTTLPETYRWLPGPRRADVRTTAPVAGWIARGRLPLSEAPAFDPWEKRPADQVNPQDQRFYYWDESGLHTLPAPVGLRFVDLLKPTPQELRDGTATALLSRGQGFELEYFVSHLDRWVWSAPAPLVFDTYHRLTGLKTLPMLRNGQVSGTAFLDESTNGKFRLTELAADQTRVTTRLLETLKPGDWLKEVLMVGESVFYRARFSLFALDRTSGGVSASNLFQYDSLSRALPSVDGAVVVPEGQGSGVSAELVRDLGPQGSGSLVRPGRYRTIGTGKCEPINELSTGVNRVVSRLTYFCGDHFVEISLN